MKDIDMLANGEFFMEDLTDEELQQKFDLAKSYFDRLSKEKTRREEKVKKEKYANILGKCFISLDNTMIYQVINLCDGKYICNRISYKDLTQDLRYMTMCEYGLCLHINMHLSDLDDLTEISIEEANKIVSDWKKKIAEENSGIFEFKEIK